MYASVRPNSKRSVGSRQDARPPLQGLAKTPTGIGGLDEITGGGLPRGRPTLVCGTAGCGKTLFAIEFLVRGATQFDEPGVFVAFEETADELRDNVRSLGFDLELMVKRRQLLVDHVRVERSEIEETGEYNLDGLFIRIAHAIETVKAKRVVLDTIEALFSGFSDDAVLRAELRRLFGWLKDRGVTAVITGERGDRHLTRRGLEEYVSDCVIVLDQRIHEQVSTRRLRIVKYRGTAHGTNEYPFLIDEQGMSVLPITSLGLEHAVSDERISTGVPALDAMFGGKWFYRGTSVLVSGTAGSGKTSLAAHFVGASCRRGERCLLFAYEESEAQVVRNMRSVGLDLRPWIDKGLLQIHSARPSSHGLEMHLVAIHKLVRTFRPQAIVMDPISNLTAVGTLGETNAMLVRLIDFFKASGITAMFTSLTTARDGLEHSEVGVSSLIDSWLVVRDLELNGERNRTLVILKSRGLHHSNQVREFLLTSSGIELREAYLGAHGVLTGSARLGQEARDREDELIRLEDTMRVQSELAVRRHAIETQIATLQDQLRTVAGDLERVAGEQRRRETRIGGDRRAMSASRHAAKTNGARDGR
jgi:circadian clock protein KaiC